MGWLCSAYASACSILSCICAIIGIHEGLSLHHSAQRIRRLSSVSNNQKYPIYKYHGYSCLAPGRGLRPDCKGVGVGSVHGAMRIERPHHDILSGVASPESLPAFQMVTCSRVGRMLSRVLVHGVSCSWSRRRTSTTARMFVVLVVFVVIFASPYTEMCSAILCFFSTTER